MPFIVIAILTASLASSCKDNENHFVKNVGDGEDTPTMLTYDVRTFISDSGYTKYKITSPVWGMYEDATVPFWFFPDGLELEQYDRNMNPVSNMRCDSAKYLSQERRWRLDGNVMMVNTMRDSFLTQQVYWDQLTRKVYSDSFIHIVRSDRVIEGYGFVSNEEMTAYSVNRPTGIFPINQQEQSLNAQQTDSAHDNEPWRRRPRSRSQQ